MTAAALVITWYAVLLGMTALCVDSEMELWRGRAELLACGPERWEVPTSRLGAAGAGQECHRAVCVTAGGGPWVARRYRGQQEHRWSYVQSRMPQCLCLGRGVP